jgi:hypothetical protein
MIALTLAIALSVTLYALWWDRKRVTGEEE